MHIFKCTYYKHGYFINSTAPCRIELPTVQVSDTTDDDSSNTFGKQKQPGL